MNTVILISEKDGWFCVRYDGKTASMLGYDEMLGLISSITMPEPRPCLRWLKTPEQIKAEEDEIPTYTDTEKGIVGKMIRHT